MEKGNTESKLVIMPENYSDMNVFKLMGKGDIEKFDCPLRYPLYFECIQSAMISIFKNHERLADERKKMKGNVPDFKSPDNVNNIIAFLGERGSGKTTAINEFGRILACIEEKKVFEWWEEHLRSSIGELEIKSFQFVVLDSIDASLLTASEDIVELVLAQMYAKIDNKFQNSRRNSEGYNIADTLDCFRTAYRNYHNLNRGVPEKELGDSVPNILKNIPSGSNVRKAFKVLLDHFFIHMEVDDQRPHYLVITIDDLDLNIDYGYQLLEKIRKYLSDPRILVLITADFKQLSRICEVYWLNQYGQDDTVRVYCDSIQYYGNGHFYSNKNTIKRNNGEDYDSSEYHESAIRLSRDYLLKAIPITHRVYLSGKKDMQKVYIHENEKNIPLKQYIWKKLVDKLGIYYDLTGTKRHFVMPDTVRGFVTYNNFLDSLYSLSWEKIPEEELEKENYFRENMSQYDWNHYRMNRDITNRMAHFSLTHRQKNEFDGLVEQNILNRAKYAVNFFENWRKNEAKDKTDVEVYRYSDLLEGIYKLGRENYNDKKLVYCIMAHFTSEMTREYYSSLFSKGREKEEANDNLRHFLGASFGNEWLGRILPEVRIDGKAGVIGRWGFVESAQLGGWLLQGKITNQEGRTWTSELISRELINSLENNKFIEILGLCMMLFSRFEKKRMTVVIPKIEFKMKNEAKKEEAESGEESGTEKKDETEAAKSVDEKVKINLQENELAYELSFLVDTANFDALGFIGKKYGEKEIDRFSRNIIQGVTDGIRKVMGKDENWSMESWNEQKLEDSINRQLKEIMGDNEMIFPFYNLDLSYNVLKHARDISMKREGIIEAEDIYAAMQKAYGYIAMELYEEDRRYDQYGITRHEMTPNSGEHEKWSMRFINSPFITRFGILYPEEMRERHKEDQREKLIDADVYCFDKSNKAETSNYAGALKNLVSSIRVPDINEAPDDNRDEEAW